MKFDISTLKDTLPVMGKGMAGIFIVTIIIILTIWLLNKLTSSKS